MTGDRDDLTGTVLDERTTFTLGELSRACGVRVELVMEMVAEGVLEPRGTAPAEWRFPGTAVVRAQKALRLTRDLQVNWPGAALALELMEEIERLRREHRAHARRMAALHGLAASRVRRR